MPEKRIRKRLSTAVRAHWLDCQRLISPGTTLAPAQRRFQTLFGQRSPEGPIRVLWLLLPHLVPFLESFAELLALLRLHPALLTSAPWDALLRNFLAVNRPELLRSLNPRFPWDSLRHASMVTAALLTKQRRRISFWLERAERHRRRASYPAAHETLLTHCRPLAVLPRKLRVSALLAEFVPRAVKRSFAAARLRVYALLSFTALCCKDPAEVLSFGARAVEAYYEFNALCPHDDAPARRQRTLYLKVLHQMRVARALLDPIRLFHFSAEPFPGLRLGSVLEAAAVGGDYFRQAKVIIVVLQPGEGVEGLVYNKRAGDVFLGGPCDRSSVLSLHNAAEVTDAREVLPGLFLGGEWQARTGEEGFLARHYRGRAGWFWGQLDGELFDGSWRLRNDVSAAEILNAEVANA